MQPSATVFPTADIEQFADMLNSSQAITLLCGSGTAGAHDEVVARIVLGNLIRNAFHTHGKVA